MENSNKFDILHSICVAILDRYIDRVSHEGQLLFSAFELLSRAIIYAPAPEEEGKKKKTHKFYFHRPPGEDNTVAQDASYLEFSLNILSSSGSAETYIFNKFAHFDDHFEILVKFVGSDEAANSSSQLICRLKGWDGTRCRLIDYDIDWNVIFLLTQYMEVDRINTSIFIETLLVLLTSLPLYTSGREEFPAPLLHMIRYLFDVCSKPIMIETLPSTEDLRSIRCLYNASSGAGNWIRGLKMVQTISPVPSYTLSPLHSTSIQVCDKLHSVAAYDNEACETLIRIVEIRRNPHSQAESRIVVVFDIASESNMEKTNHRFVLSENTNEFLRIVDECSAPTSSTLLHDNQNLIDISSALENTPDQLYYDEIGQEFELSLMKNFKIVPISDWNSSQKLHSKGAFLEDSSTSITWGSARYVNDLQRELMSKDTSKCCSSISEHISNKSIIKISNTSSSSESEEMELGGGRASIDKSALREHASIGIKVNARKIIDSEVPDNPSTSAHKRKRNETCGRFPSSIVKD